MSKLQAPSLPFYSCKNRTNTLALILPFIIFMSLHSSMTSAWSNIPKMINTIDRSLVLKKTLTSSKLHPSSIHATRILSLGVVSTRQQSLFCHHTTTQQRQFHSSSALYLNRFLFDPCEVEGLIKPNNNDDECNEENSTTTPYVTLPKNDYRTVHAAKILNVHNGDTIRAGIVGEDDLISNDDASSYQNSGLITDEAVIEWLPEGKIKKAEPTKNGDPPGSLRVLLHSLTSPYTTPSDDTASSSSSSYSQPVSLILALPRPLQLGRILPMVAQLGVDHLVLTSAQKVPKDYFGSHLFRKPNELRRHLIEGLCQAGDVKIPKVTVVRRLKPFLEDDLDSMFPLDEYARVIAHPQREKIVLENGETIIPAPPLRMRDVVFPESSNTEQEQQQQPRIVLAVGPEGGWAEDYELNMFQKCGFQQITLGKRVLRSDVAVVSLLSLAHDVCAARQ